MRKLNLTVATLGLALGVSAAPNFLNGTYVIAGNAKNWMNTSLSKSDEAVVQAVATNGTILAETTVCDPVQGCNFILRIPLSTQPSDKTAQTNDMIRLMIVHGNQRGAAGDGAVTDAASTLLTVGNADSHTNINLCIVETLSFDSTNVNHGADGKVRVAKAYLDELQPWMDAYNLVYTADDDWDGDGQSNYFEYLAGTHPLDDTDHLTIKSVDFVRITDFKTNLSSNVSASRVALTFECVNGHNYVIPSATDLSQRVWTNKKVTDELTDDPSQWSETYTAHGVKDGDTVTLYMLPAAEMKSEFFTVKPE